MESMTIPTIKMLGQGERSMSLWSVGQTHTPHSWHGGSSYYWKEHIKGLDHFHESLYSNFGSKSQENAMELIRYRISDVYVAYGRRLRDS